VTGQDSGYKLLKKKKSVFYHQIQKEIPPLPTMSTTFSERIIVTPFFQASQKELEELERALQGLEQAMNGK